MAYSVKQLVDVGAIFSTGLKKDTVAEFGCYTFAFLITDNSLSLEVSLVSGQGDDYVGRSIIINILNPLGQVDKSFAVSHRINLHNCQEVRVKLLLHLGRQYQSDF